VREGGGALVRLGGLEVLVVSGIFRPAGESRDVALAGSAHQSLQPRRAHPPEAQSLPVARTVVH